MDQKQWLKDIEFQKQLVMKKEREKVDCVGEFERLLALKEDGILALAAEVAELKVALENVETVWESKMFEAHKSNEKKSAMMREDLSEVTRKLSRADKDCLLLRRELADALKTPDRIDPEKIRLQKIIGEQELEIEERKRAVLLAQEDNEELEGRYKRVKEKFEIELEDSNKIGERETKRRRFAEEEVLRMKNMLVDKLKESEELVTEIEDRYRSLPNPFEDEVNEMRAKAEAQKRALEQTTWDVDGLERALKREKREREDEVLDLQKKLVYATVILNEVAALKEIRGLVEWEEYSSVLGMKGGVVGSPERDTAAFDGMWSAKLGTGASSKAVLKAVGKSFQKGLPEGLKPGDAKGLLAAKSMIQKERDRKDQQLLAIGRDLGQLPRAGAEGVRGGKENRDEVTSDAGSVESAPTTPVKGARGGINSLPASPKTGGKDLPSSGQKP